MGLSVFNGAYGICLVAPKIERREGNVKILARGNIFRSGVPSWLLVAVAALEPEACKSHSVVHEGSHPAEDLTVRAGDFF